MRDREPKTRPPLQAPKPDHQVSQFSASVQQDPAKQNEELHAAEVKQFTPDAPKLSQYVFGLQRAHGNRYVQRVVARAGLQQEIIQRDPQPVHQAGPKTPPGMEKKATPQEEADLDKFSKQHPNVDTDQFRDAIRELDFVLNEQFFPMQLSGVETAKDEVLKYKKKEAIPPSNVLFDIAMLAVDIASAGVAGRIGKLLETDLKAVRSVTTIAERGTFKTVTKELPKLTDATVASVVDSVKEAIKGSSKLARKNVGKSGPAAGRQPASADPRIDFFDAQRQALILGRSEVHEGYTAGIQRLRPLLLKDPKLAVESVKQMAAGLRKQLNETSAEYAAEAVRQWILLISEPRMDLNKTGSVEGHEIGEIKGVVDIGFYPGRNPYDPVQVKSARILGVSNAVAHRLKSKPLIDLGVPVRAYGVPGPNYAEFLVTVVRTAGGSITWMDQTNGSAPGPADWLKRKSKMVSEEAGAKILIENDIMGSSLDEHGVELTTDQDPKLEGG